MRRVPCLLFLPPIYYLCSFALIIIISLSLSVCVCVCVCARARVGCAHEYPVTLLSQKLFFFLAGETNPTRAIEKRKLDFTRMQHHLVPQKVIICIIPLIFMLFSHIII